MDPLKGFSTLMVLVLIALLALVLFLFIVTSFS